MKPHNVERFLDTWNKSIYNPTIVLPNEVVQLKPHSKPPMDTFDSVDIVCQTGSDVDSLQESDDFFLFENRTAQIPNINNNFPQSPVMQKSQIVSAIVNASHERERVFKLLDRVSNSPTINPVLLTNPLIYSPHSRPKEIFKTSSPKIDYENDVYSPPSDLLLERLPLSRSPSLLISPRKNNLSSHSGFANHKDSIDKSTTYDRHYPLSSKSIKSNDQSFNDRTIPSSDFNVIRQNISHSQTSNPVISSNIIYYDYQSQQQEPIHNSSPSNLSPKSKFSVPPITLYTSPPPPPMNSPLNESHLISSVEFLLDETLNFAPAAQPGCHENQSCSKCEQQSYEAKIVRIAHSPNSPLSNNHKRAGFVQSFVSSNNGKFTSPTSNKSPSIMASPAGRIFRKHPNGSSEGRMKQDEEANIRAAYVTGLCGGSLREKENYINTGPCLKHLKSNSLKLPNKTINTRSPSDKKSKASNDIVITSLSNPSPPHAKVVAGGLKEAITADFNQNKLPTSHVVVETLPSPAAVRRQLFVPVKSKGRFDFSPSATLDLALLVCSRRYREDKCENGINQIDLDLLGVQESIVNTNSLNKKVIQFLDLDESMHDIFLRSLKKVCDWDMERAVMSREYCDSLRRRIHGLSISETHQREWQASDGKCFPFISTVLSSIAYPPSEAGSYSLPKFHNHLQDRIDFILHLPLRNKLDAHHAPSALPWLLPASSDPTPCAEDKWDFDVGTCMSPISLFETASTTLSIRFFNPIRKTSSPPTLPHNTSSSSGKMEVEIRKLTEQEQRLADANLMNESPLSRLAVNLSEHRMKKTSTTHNNSLNKNENLTDDEAKLSLFRDALSLARKKISPAHADASSAPAKKHTVHDEENQSKAFTSVRGSAVRSMHMLPRHTKTMIESRWGGSGSLPFLVFRGQHTSPSAFGWITDVHSILESMSRSGEAHQVIRALHEVLLSRFPDILSWGMVPGLLKVTEGVENLTAGRTANLRTSGSYLCVRTLLDNQIRIPLLIRCPPTGFDEQNAPTSHQEHICQNAVDGLIGSFHEEAIHLEPLRGCVDSKNRAFKACTEGVKSLECWLGPNSVLGEGKLILLIVIDDVTSSSGSPLSSPSRANPMLI